MSVLGDKYEKEYLQNKVAKPSYEAGAWRNHCSAMRTKRYFSIREQATHASSCVVINKEIHVVV